IRHVGGDVLIDTRLFDTARGSGSGPGIVTPILVNDNIIDVTITPGQAPGQPAAYESRPKTDFAQVDVQVETGEKKERTRIETRRVGPGRWTVRGKIAEGASPQVRICAVDDPSGFARALFIEALRREGVAVPASVLRAPTAELPEAVTYSKLP